MSAATDAGTTPVDLDDRDVRALTEYLYVYDDVGRAAGADGLYLVYGEAGTEYLVDAVGGACECDDAFYRDPDGGCKHLRRVAFLLGRPIPSWVDQTAIDDWLLEARADEVGAD